MNERTEESIAGSTILVVEDHPQTRELLEAYLEDLPEVRTVTASNGAQAVEQAARHQPDLILLDVMMPKLSGFEVCRRIKEDPRTRDTVVAVVTALDDETEREFALHCGADDFLRKPVSRIELVARVRSLLKIRRLQRERSESHVSPPPRRPDELTPP
jgi:two-component system alkaline phosphatase synthesis response regulator PhoP